MKSWQKLIKYAAIALAIFLIVSIISRIVGAVDVLSRLFDNGNVLENMREHAVSQDITALKVDINAADFTIENGETFTVESNLDKLNVTVNNGTLVITERSKSYIGNGYRDAVLTLCVPEDFVFTKAEIQTGAGRFSVDTLSSEQLILKLGAGEVDIEELNASNTSEIVGGAGAITIRSGILRDLDFEMGVGKLDMTAAVLDEGEFDFGVGEANLTLVGSEAEYRLRLDKGLGSARVSGENMQEDRAYGSGNNMIDMEGGIGNINIDFTENIHP